MINSKAVMIGSVKYSDDESIVSVFTREAGMVTFMSRKKLRLLPMSIIDVCFEHRANRRIQYFKDIRLNAPLADLAQNPYKMTIVMFLAEVLRHALREEKGNTGLFDYIETQLHRLNDADGDYACFHITFLTDILKHLGYDPKFDTSLTKAPRLMNHNERNRHTEVLIEYFRQHLPSFPEIKSLKVLEGIFD